MTESPGTVFKLTFEGGSTLHILCKVEATAEDFIASIVRGTQQAAKDYPGTPPPWMLTGGKTLGYRADKVIHVEVVPKEHIDKGNAMLSKLFEAITKDDDEGEEWKRGINPWDASDDEDE